MDPKDLLRELMARSKDTPSSLSRKVKNATKQPQIYRFLEGVAKEPRRTTLQPLADYYRINVEAFYNPVIAAQVMQQLHGEPPAPEALPAAPEKHQEAVGQLSPAAMRLGLLFDLLSDGLDGPAAYQTATQAVIDAVQRLQSPPSGAPAPAAKRERQRG